MIAKCSFPENPCLSSSAPSNLLTAIEHLRALREMVEVPGMSEVARVALLKREPHLHMLAPELSVFHLFNHQATEDSRARMARALLSYIDQWVVGEFLIDPVSPTNTFCSLFYLSLS